MVYSLLVIRKCISLDSWLQISLKTERFSNQRKISIICPATFVSQKMKLQSLMVKLYEIYLALFNTFYGHSHYGRQRRLFASLLTLIFTTFLKISDLHNRPKQVYFEQINKKKKSRNRKLFFAWHHPWEALLRMQSVKGFRTYRYRTDTQPNDLYF